MTTNLNRSHSKTRDRHQTDAAPRRGTRPGPSPEGRSADEIRADVKQAVGKGVAAVAGAVEGVDETLMETQLADTAESAVRQVGETATKVVRAAKEEGDNLRQALRGDLSEEEDWSTERDDPTFRPFGKRPTEATTSGAPLAYGADEEQSAATYEPGADDVDESKAI